MQEIHSRLQQLVRDGSGGDVWGEGSFAQDVLGLVGTVLEMLQREQPLGGMPTKDEL